MRLSNKPILGGKQFQITWLLLDWGTLRSPMADGRCFKSPPFFPTAEHLDTHSARNMIEIKRLPFGKPYAGTYAKGGRR
jgi:hypothetical protein